MVAVSDLQAEIKNQNEIQEEHEEIESSCGWLNFRPKFLQIFNRPCSLLFFLCAYFIANSTVINGIYSTSISTIEKRFNLSSTQMGMVTSIYDIAALIFTCPVAYLGARRKPRWLGCGMLVMGFGYLIFILPHFIGKPYQPAIGVAKKTVNSTSNLLCNQKDNQTIMGACDANDGSNLYYGIFLLAMFIAGAGCTPMLTLGIPFLDESVSEHESPLYLGILQCSGIIAAIGGFILSSVFLNIFVHPGASITITPKNVESWIGAWWLGFAVAAGFAFLIGISLMAFPRQLKNKDKRDQNMNKIDAQQLTQKEFLKSLKILLFENPTYICICFAVSFQNFIISSATAFSPKIAIFQFQLSPSKVGLYYGVFLGGGALTGTFAGSYFHKKMKLSTRGALKLAVIISFLSLISNSYMYLYCENPPTAGINIKYATRFGNSNEEQRCNVNCSCQADLYLPICGKKTTYISPCHGGCKFSSAKTFSNCSCLNGDSLKNEDATLGACRATCGIFPYLFFALAALNAFFVSFISVPCTIATLRCTPFRLRSFAVGIQWTMVRVFGSIPGPILLGYIIDKCCVFWYTKCDSQRSCRIYDNEKLAISSGLAFSCTSAIINVFLILALVAQIRAEKNKYLKEQVNVDETHL